MYAADFKGGGGNPRQAVTPAASLISTRKVAYIRYRATIVWTHEAKHVGLLMEYFASYHWHIKL